MIFRKPLWECATKLLRPVRKVLAFDVIDDKAVIWKTKDKNVGLGKVK